MKDQNINILYWIAMVAMVVYFAYIKGWILVNFDSISPLKVSALMEGDEDDNVTLLDVRTPLEFAREHIDGAKLIPLNLLKESLSKLKDSQTKKIVVYCHSGNRSIRASRILQANGFTPINMRGGLIEWKKSGFGVVKVAKTAK